MFYLITFSEENDYRLSNDCHCIYFITRSY